MIADAAFEPRSATKYLVETDLGGDPSAAQLFGSVRRRLRTAKRVCNCMAGFAAVFDEESCQPERHSRAVRFLAELAAALLIGDLGGATRYISGIVRRLRAFWRGAGERAHRASRSWCACHGHRVATTHGADARTASAHANSDRSPPGGADFMA